MRALTTADLVRVFDVTAMTIYNWRKADPAHARKSPLPSTVTPRLEVTFNAIRVKAWATKNGVPMALDPIDLADGGTGALHKKPGPKPAVKTRRSTAKDGGPRLTEAEVRKIAGTKQKATKTGKPAFEYVRNGAGRLVQQPIRKGTAFRKQADREVKAAAESKARKAGKTIKRSALRA